MSDSTILKYWDKFISDLKDDKVSVYNGNEICDMRAYPLNVTVMDFNDGTDIALATALSLYDLPDGMQSSEFAGFTHLAISNENGGINHSIYPMTAGEVDNARNYIIDLDNLGDIKIHGIDSVGTFDNVQMIDTGKSEFSLSPEFTCDGIDNLRHVLLSQDIEDMNDIKGVSESLRTIQKGIDMRFVDSKNVEDVKSAIIDVVENENEFDKLTDTLIGHVNSDKFKILGDFNVERLDSKPLGVGVDVTSIDESFILSAQETSFVMLPESERTSDFSGCLVCKYYEYDGVDLIGDSDDSIEIITDCQIYPLSDTDVDMVNRMINSPGKSNKCFSDEGELLSPLDSIGFDSESGISTMSYGISDEVMKEFEPDNHVSVTFTADDIQPDKLREEIDDLKLLVAEDKQQQRDIEFIGDYDNDYLDSYYDSLDDVYNPYDY